MAPATTASAIGSCFRSRITAAAWSGFGGRTLGAARAKYLNTPETPAFRKGELLYGLPLARAAIRERGRVIVAEGYMDVIALAQAGFAHAVAAARHRDRRGAARAAVATRRRAADLSGRRRGRPAGGSQADRTRAADAQAGQVATLRDPAAGAGSRLGAACRQRRVPLARRRSSSCSTRRSRSWTFCGRAKPPPVHPRCRSSVGRWSNAIARWRAAFRSGRSGACCSTISSDD